MAQRWCAYAIAAVLAGAIGCGDKQRDVPAAAPVLTKPSVPAAITSAKIAGTVVDQRSGKPVGNVDVVLLGATEQKARAGADGRFELTVTPGIYRAFVRGDSVLTVGLADRTRLDNAPRAEMAGVRDEALLPMLDARAPLDDVELTVVPTATLAGFVFDEAQHPVANAVVRTRDFDRLDAVRPVLGTDVAVTDEAGHFMLRVPPGHYQVDATHPQFAGTRDGIDIELEAGKPSAITITMARGCIVSGRVVNADGSPATDGAVELRGPRGGFGPAGRLDAGSFRWVTTEDDTVTLRAWPWRSPPSNEKTFECRDGKRFTDVVLRLPDQDPDLSGTIVDANEQPVPLAYLDMQPLDPGLPGQQERGDAAGEWGVFDVPPARYRLTASAPGLGIVDTMTTAPRRDLRLVLGGTGRIVGTTTDLASGSVEVSFLRCGSKDDPLRIAHEPRIVPVRAGHFTIERAPACTLSLAVRWRDTLVESTAVVEPNRTAYIDVDIGTPREKTVTGTVRDAAGSAVEGARVTAVLHDREAATARTDSSGHYTLQTHSGAQLVAGKGEHTGHGAVGQANVASEQVDLVLDDTGY
ncbi:MAG TPA: carboxypeptidase regulatory-like domain-containing protein [Kofleriaceae bacterium]|nr:carboxypeptidase regulatory-like domain-containing protein [Kofleriaceae bacterium]